jgi:GNAT superfamily N-acetyltransferase
LNATLTLENAERGAFEAWFRAARQSCPASFGWSLVDIGDARCSVCTSDPSILVNRVFGLGSRGEPAAAQLAAIRRVYAEAGVERFFLHVTPGYGSELRSRLEDAGFERYRGWMKFTRGTDPVETRDTGLALRTIGRNEAAAFAAIACAAFDLEKATEAAVAALVEAEGWSVHMSFDGGEPAGCGALYVRGAIGYLDWGATRPEYRRRGSQTALLGARLRAARDAGCETIVTMTGEAVPGDPQQSYSNILRAGFAEAYLRENWIPARRD